MKEVILSALYKLYEGERAKHLVNIKVYLENPVGIGEHPDVLEAIDSEIAKAAEAQEKLDLLDKWSYTDNKNLD